MTQFYFTQDERGGLDSAKFLKGLEELLAKHHAKDIFPDIDFSFGWDCTLEAIQTKVYQIGEKGILMYHYTKIPDFESQVVLGRFDEESETYKDIRKQLTALGPCDISE